MSHRPLLVESLFPWVATICEVSAKGLNPSYLLQISLHPWKTHPTWRTGSLADHGTVAVPSLSPVVSLQLFFLSHTQRWTHKYNVWGLRCHLLAFQQSHSVFTNYYVWIPSLDVGEGKDTFVLPLETIVNHLLPWTLHSPNTSDTKHSLYPPCIPQVSGVKQHHSPFCPFIPCWYDSGWSQAISTSWPKRKVSSSLLPLLIAGFFEPLTFTLLPHWSNILLHPFWCLSPWLACDVLQYRGSILFYSSMHASY
jgi:hypothetical protein